MQTLQTALTWLAGFALACYLASLIFVAGGYLLSRLVAPLRPMDEAQRAAFAVKHGPVAIGFGILAEAGYQLLTISSDITRLFLGARRLPTAKTGMPVLICPGYVESSGSMVYLGQWLRAQGFRVFLIEYPSTFAPITSNARHLRRRIAEIREQTGEREVAVVGHSMGGVIARCLIHTDPQAHAIRTLVCIASPHQGVTRRALAPGRSALDMSFGSEHMHAFPVSKRSDVPIHTVVGVLDQIVNPPWATMTSEGDNHVMQRAIGHMGPLFLAESRAKIAGWLRAEGVEPVAPVDA